MASGIASIPAQVLILSLIFPLTTLCDQTYESLNTLMGDRLGQGHYNTMLRPLLNQSEIIKIHTSFTIHSIVELNNVHQQFSINGQMAMSWEDQLLKWNASEYGGVKYMALEPWSAWKPRVNLVNTLDKNMDPFQESISIFTVHSNGQTTYFPGGVFTTSCELDMKKFPFDQQVCYLRFCSTNYDMTELVFSSSSETVYVEYFVPNEGWVLTSTRAYISTKESLHSCPMFEFTITRRPTYFLVNIVLPIGLLSFLNNFAFVIPVKSGEKISFGVTLVLAQALFLSLVSSMIPESASTIPQITIYIITQLVSSVVDVITTTFVVGLNQQDEERAEHLNTSSQFSKILYLMNSLVVATSDLKDGETGNGESGVGSEHVKLAEKLRTDTEPKSKCSFVRKHINKICFCVSVTSWSLFTMYYFYNVL